jgi:hypothetical protein
VKTFPSGLALVELRWMVCKPVAEGWGRTCETSLTNKVEAGGLFLGTLAVYVAIPEQRASHAVAAPRSGIKRGAMSRSRSRWPRCLGLLLRAGGIFKDSRIR